MEVGLGFLKVRTAHDVADDGRVKATLRLGAGTEVQGSVKRRVSDVMVLEVAVKADWRRGVFLGEERTRVGARSEATMLRELLFLCVSLRSPLRPSPKPY